uniref:Uncharacterized protein n=1 Tax=Aegilops tauschii subsp. strangulata TaxID=200361 RepID=A0A453PNW8_AEGTS
DSRSPHADGRTQTPPMALQSCHHHDDCRVAPPPLPDWGWEWEWDWEELVRCQLGDAARDGIHGALPGLPSLGGGEEESPVSSSEASTGGGGYLEDAVAQWGDRSKRQRTAVEGPPRCPAMASEDLQCLLQSFWDSSSGEGALLHDLNTMAPAPAPETSGFLSGD